MPESNKGANARRLKSNRAAGIGDEMGRIPARVKTEAIMLCCSVCKSELKVTKTNTELRLHAESKHGKTLEECFAGAEEHAKALVEKANAGKKGGAGKNSGGDGMTKKERKKKGEDGANDLLSAGLSTKKKSSKKR
mmetsp:Transcript_33062/g.37010  ORF Transcript_33062/g.37010 Transcript_33062/m.37010 type:complete len:136 (+) Transcript_33062:94-501(+)|eukprot:CAMPEP_0170804126 /NCGR_PEP_ID=MMETSP0733-20121128/30510_1 /TAXON_ID=186038 /ORGANISM="Fragilariopsis kerguelensis, Strain L26-C5" /LENGTH=135 /DNA_ID=CAMNT_0011158099 /DNA_START=74 /DNA_END=481 /DNA_ORIENTATION=+